MPERILIAGLGSAGRRHLRNLRALGCDVAVLRRTARDAEATTAEHGVAAFHTPAAAVGWKPRRVVVSNVTSKHVATARWAIEHGYHVFIEKPIAHAASDVESLLQLADARRKCVAVGCNLRFHPALEAIRSNILDGRIGRLLTARAEVGSYLPDWHPEADYRTEYSARKALGGGALLTLIHELDYVLWIAGPVTEANGRRARVSSLEIDVDDVAEIICRHASGALTSIHMDFLDRAYNRRSRWVGERGTIEWRWGGPVELLLPDGRRDVLWENPLFDDNETYVRELSDFLSASTTGRAPRTSGWEALATLQTALVAAERR
jgi:predicted dehydrogenase